MQTSESGAFKGADDLMKVSKLISHVFVPLEEKNPNTKTFLENFTKIVKESITQLTGSKAIEVPTSIEPNEDKALRDPDTVAYYRQLLVCDSLTLGDLDSIHQSQD
jgi:hypothetical protein